MHPVGVGQPAVGAPLVAPVEDGDVEAARLQVLDGLEIALDEVAAALEDAHRAASDVRPGAQGITQDGAIGSLQAPRHHALGQVVAGAGEQPRLSGCRLTVCRFQRLRTSVSSPLAALSLIE